MEKDEVFRKYLHDTTNNQPMVDAIVNLHQTAGTDEHGSEMFTDSLFSMLQDMDLCQTICRIRDLVFDLGDTLDVDPSYSDATVSDEPNRKLQSICLVRPLETPLPPLAQMISDMKHSYRDRVMDPMNTQFRVQTPYERLEREIMNHR